MSILVEYLQCKKFVNIFLLFIHSLDPSPSIKIFQFHNWTVHSVHPPKLCPDFSHCRNNNAGICSTEPTIGRPGLRQASVQHLGASCWKTSNPADESGLSNTSLLFKTRKAQTLDNKLPFSKSIQICYWATVQINMLVSGTEWILHDHYLRS